MWALLRAGNSSAHLNFLSSICFAWTRCGRTRVGNDFFWRGDGVLLRRNTVGRVGRENYSTYTHCLHYLLLWTLSIDRCSIFLVSRGSLVSVPSFSHSWSDFSQNAIPVRDIHCHQIYTSSIDMALKNIALVGVGFMMLLSSVKLTWFFCAHGLSSISCASNII